MQRLAHCYRTRASICLTFAAVIWGSGWASGEPTLQADWGAPKVQVRQEGPQWIIEGQRNRLTLTASDLKIMVDAQGAKWELVPSFAGDLVVEHQGRSISLRLADASKKEISAYETGFKSGVMISLGGWMHENAAMDLDLRLSICLEGKDEDLVCELAPQEKAATVLECFWPGGLEAASFDTTIVPYMQGMFLPKDWPQKVWLYDPQCYGRGLYMPWWGHQNGPSAMLLVIETPDDAGCRFDHPAGGPTRMQLRWLHSLGRMRYPRRARLCFLKSGNYVDCAKRYRRYIIETGRFVSLKEKMARNPLVARLQASPVVHTGILVHIQPESSYYNKDNPAANHYVTTFDARAAELRALASRGTKRAYVHLDGWGFRGYDNLHPDVLPPSPEAGGWEGMKRLADACDEIGYLFAIHDQYRDYYWDAKSYSPRHAVLDRGGNRWHGSTWYGGNQSILCSSLAPGHVRKNYGGLIDHGIKVRGAYLDVFAVVTPDECYSPEHPVTRTDCLRYRAECFALIRAMGGVVSSEEPADWAMPHTDLVHHGPYALVPDPGRGPAMGVPVPLFSLVYHDAIFLPWSLTKGAWGIPQDDLGFLHGLANAGLPYLSTQPSEEELKQVRAMCALQERVGLLEMTRHEFLDASRRRQRTTFADGTTVTIDLAGDSFEIAPPLPPDAM